MPAFGVSGGVQLCREAAIGARHEEECQRTSRELQNAIYARRASSPLIFPRIYKRLRPQMEASMNEGVADLLSELRALR
ncbi:S-4TM family putative pore-forming effector [Roseomonas rosulenta]|uniref:S-4TM family putative pore-forming effector n=1 Tax=Roseomonas rosulenta TaxID=2748667 RepID=UPI0018DFDC31